MPDWATRDDREWRDEGVHKLARRPKTPQPGPSVPPACRPTMHEWGADDTCRLCHATRCPAYTPPSRGGVRCGLAFPCQYHKSA
jgi:hypothetical protein